MPEHNPYQPPAAEHVDAVAHVRRVVLARDVILRGAMPIGDVLHTQRVLLLHRWPYILTCLLIYVAMVCAMGMMSPVGGTMIFLGLVAAPCLVPFTILFSYFRMRKDANNQVGLFAETETRLATSGINAMVGGSPVAVDWEAFRGFRATSRVIVLFLKGTNNHLIISRAKLVSADDWQVLLDFFHERWPIQ